MLEDHEPVLRFDARERDRLMSVRQFATETGIEVPGVRPLTSGAHAPAIYGRRVGDGGATWLQYWLLFDYNSQDRGIVRTGRHEGDWEMVQVRLGPSGAVEAATFTQHSSAEGCPASGLELARQRPVVYIANGSHALYPRPGVHDRPFPDPNDEARGDGVTEVFGVEPIGAGERRWLAWDGHWGDSRAGFVPGEQSSPRGPAHQGERWDAPAAFHEGARACGTLPARFPWLYVAAALAAAAAAVALARVRARSLTAAG
ncbi:MAG: hypothetical protein QOJ22_134 [Thermoleophilaceae bacterium]|nr:hypothetical protein [Thermoleophilaceae bacterium]